jgi:exoribonuclease R
MKTNKPNTHVGLTEVHDVLRANKGRALHVMEICARLSLEPSQRDDLRDLLDELKERGHAQELPGQRYKLAKPARAGAGPVVPEVTRRPEPPPRPKSSDSRFSRDRAPAPNAKLGTLRIHPRGHGFVNCDDGSDDVFVAPPELLGALHGDRVAVSARRSERGFEGTIIAVLERSQKYVAGLLSLTATGLVIEPSDARLPKLVRVVGRVPGDAVPGIAVVAQIVRYPDDGSAPEAWKAAPRSRSRRSSCARRSARSSPTTCWPRRARTETG